MKIQNEFRFSREVEQLFGRSLRVAIRESTLQTS